MEYQRTKFGNFMYKFLQKATKPLINHIWLYYLLNYTWGIITTFFGWLTLGILSLIFIKKTKERGLFGPCCYIMFGNNWGGLELGTNFIIADGMGEEWTLHTKCHELGHTFQNAILGPFAIFLVFIPSFIRYWYREIKGAKVPYDAIWFEGSATDIGTDYFNTNVLK